MVGTEERTRWENYFKPLFVTELSKALSTPTAHFTESRITVDNILPQPASHGIVIVDVSIETNCDSRNAGELDGSQCQAYLDTLIKEGNNRTIGGHQIIKVGGLHALEVTSLDQVFVGERHYGMSVGAIVGIIFSVIIGLGCAGVCFWKRAVIMKRLKSMRGGRAQTGQMRYNTQVDLPGGAPIQMSMPPQQGGMSLVANAAPTGAYSPPLAEFGGAQAIVAEDSTKI